MGTGQGQTGFEHGRAPREAGRSNSSSSIHGFLFLWAKTLAVREPSRHQGRGSRQGRKPCCSPVLPLLCLLGGPSRSTSAHLPSCSHCVTCKTSERTRASGLYLPPTISFPILLFGTFWNLHSFKQISSNPEGTQEESRAVVVGGMGCPKAPHPGTQSPPPLRRKAAEVLATSAVSWAQSDIGCGTSCCDQMDQHCRAAWGLWLTREDLVLEGFSPESQVSAGDTSPRSPVKLSQTGQA